MYILHKYNIQVKDIPKKYKYNQTRFPNPLNNKDEKPLFEQEWKRFQIDFKNGAFLDESLKLVYNSVEM